MAAVDIEIPFDEIGEEAEQTSKTYRLDLDKGRIYGKIDGIEAVNQAIRKAILTLRFNNIIYDDDYGCEAGNVIHSRDVTPEYLETAIPEMIKDAVLQDSRIIDVSDFELQFENDSAYINFKVSTIFGESEITEVM